ncbi:MAG: adenosylcobinamide amidohydrolase [Methanolobus sp.]|nr:adenosylcobinamide amidohydrolase [Methanolobus sp.]
MMKDPENTSAANPDEEKCSPLADRSEVLLLETSGGERVYRKSGSIVVVLPEGRSALTTSWVNGGYREDLQAIFNHHVPRGKHSAEDLEGGSVPAYLEFISKNLGLDPERTSGLLTAACMENAAIVTRSFRGVEVTAIVTGGIEINGGRVGDPASYYQEGGTYQFIQGTINTILLIGANLPAYSMTRAIVTATEAKTAALQQLVAPSRHSTGIATGSGTDMIAIVSDRSSPVMLNDAGKHSKLGEMIGRCVLEATLKALERQSDLTPLYQRDMMVRLERFGVDEAMYWKAASKLEGQNRKGAFLKTLREFSKNPALVGSTAAVLHLLDEISWELIPETAGRKTAIAIMKGLPALLGCTVAVSFDDLLDEKKDIIDNWVNITAWLVKNANPGECLRAEKDKR